MRKYKYYYLAKWHNKNVLAVFRHKRNIPKGFIRIGKTMLPVAITYENRDELLDHALNIAHEVKNSFMLVVYGDYRYAKKICPNMTIIPSKNPITYTIGSECLLRYRVNKNYIVSVKMLDEITVTGDDTDKQHSVLPLVLNIR